MIAKSIDLVWLAGERSVVAAIPPAFDVLALSLLSDGISSTLLEAMASAMRGLAESPERRARGVQAARVRALREYRLRGMVRRYADLYQREIERRAPRAAGGATRAHGATVE